VGGDALQKDACTLPSIVVLSKATGYLSIFGVQGLMVLIYICIYIVESLGKALTT